MSTAGPPQGARPPGGERRAAPVGGEDTRTAGPPQGARPPGGERRAAPVGEGHSGAAASRYALPVTVIAALLALPLAVTGFYVEFTTKVMILSIFALSLELLVGATGLVSLGHAAFFGIAAYATVLLSPQTGAANFFWLLPAAIACSAGYALAVGALSLRTRGVYFIMVTLAFAQMAYYVFHDTDLGGGTDGIYLNVKPAVALYGWTLLEVGEPLVFYYLVLACLLLVFGFLAVLLRSRFGRALAGIKSNEQRMRAAGFPTFPYKLAAFTLAGALAGLAGFLVAVKDGFVNPEMLSWHESGAVLLMLILGGMGRLSGAVLGAFVFALLQLFFQWEAMFGSFADHWQLLLGGTIILCVAFMPNGLIGLPAQWRAWRVRRSVGAIDG
jgi:branched-chain amino acid transport system permease protein